MIVLLGQGGYVCAYPGLVGYRLVLATFEDLVGTIILGHPYHDGSDTLPGGAGLEQPMKARYSSADLLPGRRITLEH
jgi:hypothetical protein